MTPGAGHSPALCLGVPSIPALRAFALPFPTFRCGVVLIPRNRYVRPTGRTGDSRMIRCRFPFMTALRAGYELLCRRHLVPPSATTIVSILFLCWAMLEKWKGYTRRGFPPTSAGRCAPMEIWRFNHSFCIVLGQEADGAAWPPVMGCVSCMSTCHHYLLRTLHRSVTPLVPEAPQ